MWNFDAHVHSSVSDGTDSPLALVHKAKKAGLTGVALTDHDLFADLEPVWAEAEDKGILVVRGIELSTSYQRRSAHLLAYDPDPHSKKLTSLLMQIRERRRVRVREIVESVQSEYPQVTWERLLEHQREVGETGAPGRPHIADLLVRLGIVPTRSAAFAEILSHKSPHYVPQWAPDPREMVEIVRAAGGVPVLAHPLSEERQRPLPTSVIGEMTDAGLYGLERDHREHSPRALAEVDRLARDLGLATTGGSDYHGYGKPNELGENTTDRETMEMILSQGVSQRGSGA